MKTRIALAVAATLALAACTPPDAGAAGSAAPVATVTVTFTPSPAPSPSAPPAVAEQPDFDFTHFEGAQIGSTWSQMSTQLGVEVAGAYDCPWFGSLWSTERISTWAFTDPDNPNGPSMFFLTRRSYDAVTGPYPHNAERVGVGSTQAEILAAYPTAVVSTWNDISAGDLTLITVPDPASSAKYIFAFSSGETKADMLMWGNAVAEGQWGHLCSGL